MVPPGFEPQTVQHIAFRYADYAIPALNADQGLPLFGALNLQTSLMRLFSHTFTMRRTPELNKQLSLECGRHYGVRLLVCHAPDSFSVDIYGVAGYCTET